MSAKAGICVFDVNGLITLLDAGAEEISGCPPRTALGRKVVELFPFVDLLRESKTEGESTEISYTRPNGSRVRVTYTLARTPDGGGIIALIRFSAREDAIEELIQSERQNRLLFEQSPFPTWVYDIETLKFLDVNPAAIDHYGYSREEFLSMTLKDIRPSEDVPALVEAARRNALAFRSGGRWRHRRKDGRILTVDVTATATTYAERRAKLAVIRDVSEWEESERKVAEAAALIDAIANTVPLAIWGIDSAGNVNFWNRKAEELFGWQEAEVIGTPLPFILLDGISEASSTAMSVDTPGSTTRRTPPDASVERPVRCRGGKVLYCALWNAALRDPRGNEIGSIGVAADTTERRRSQEQLATYVQSLARSNDDLRQFAYAASHDLQEPLRNVRLFAELLGNSELPEDGRRREYLAHIRDGAKQIQDLVRGLRKYWELSDGMPDLTKKVDASAVLKRVLAGSRDALEASGATLKFKQLPLLLGSEQELATVFEELLSNAIRFRGQAPLEIEISACASPSRSSIANRTESSSMDTHREEWQICVRDNGNGFSPVYATKIFEIFKRLSRSYEGIGLGLALVKRIVERHGGRVWVQSAEGQGCAFYFTWPALRENQ